MTSSEKIAIAAHLHVLLRRKTGRVTDTEWMASNAVYALEMVRFAREKAAEDGHADLALWADRLEGSMAAPEIKPRMPLVRLVTEAVKERSVASAPLLQQRDMRSVGTEDELYPESGFIESTFGNLFGNSEIHRQREVQDPSTPRYVKGLR